MLQQFVFQQNVTLRLARAGDLWKHWYRAVKQYKRITNDLQKSWSLEFTRPARRKLASFVSKDFWRLLYRVYTRSIAHYLRAARGKLISTGTERTATLQLRVRARGKQYMYIIIHVVTITIGWVGSDPVGTFLEFRISSTFSSLASVRARTTDSSTSGMSRAAIRRYYNILLSWCAVAGLILNKTIVQCNHCLRSGKRAEVHQRYTRALMQHARGSIRLRRTPMQ